MPLHVTVKQEADIGEIARRYPAFAQFKNKPTPETAEYLCHRADRNSYDMLVTFLGKTGYGKSTTVNRIVARQLFETSDVTSCTRVCQCADFDLTGDRKYYISFVDGPGLGESVSLDREYLALYDQLIQKTTVFVYLLRVDQRDYTIDEVAFRQLFSSTESRDRVIIALNAADKVEPLTRAPRFSPTTTQMGNLTAKRQQVANAFSVPLERVVVYSAAEDWNMAGLLETIASQLAQHSTQGSLRQRLLAREQIERNGQIVNSTVYTYDQAGRLVTEQSSQLNSSGTMDVFKHTYECDSQGRRIRSFDSLGYQTRYEYDRWGNQCRTYETNGRYWTETRREYRSDGKWVFASYRDSGGHWEEYRHDYDDRGNEIRYSRRTPRTSSVQEYEHDQNNRVVRTRGDTDSEFEYVEDAAGQIVKRNRFVYGTLKDVTEFRYERDANGQLVREVQRMTDASRALKKVTEDHYQRDGNGQLVRKVQRVDDIPVRTWDYEGGQLTREETVTVEYRLVIQYEDGEVVRREKKESTGTTEVETYEYIGGPVVLTKYTHADRA